MPLQGRPLLYTVSTLTALSFCLIGYDNGVIGGLTETEGWKRAFEDPNATALQNADTLSTIVSIYEIGCAIGALVTFIIGERIGRKKTLAIGAVWMALGAALQASPYGVPQMIAARVISGVGMGMLNSTAPVLQAEVSPKATRGRYVCAQLSALNFGIMLSYWLDYGVTRNYTSDFSWRFPIAFQLILIIPIFILSFLVCESPRWMANHGRAEESQYIVARLMGCADNPNDPAVRERYEEISNAVAYEQSVASNSWKSLFANDRLSSRRRLLIACSVQFFQQLGGINAIIYYAGFLFSQSLGFSPSLAALLSGLLFTWFFIASFIPWFLIDSWGRKPLFLYSVSFMAIIFAVMTGLTHQIDNGASNARACGFAAVVMAFLYMGAFTTGFQATVWVYPPELLPLRIRAKGTALATFCNWIINFAVVKIFPIAITNIGWRTYAMFFAFNASFVPIMWFFYVETKGKSLEEIDLLFDKGQAGTMIEAKSEVTHMEQTLPAKHEE